MASSSLLFTDFLLMSIPLKPLLLELPLLLLLPLLVMLVLLLLLVLLPLVRLECCGCNGILSASGPSSTIAPEFLIQCALKGNSALAYGVPSLSMHIIGPRAMAKLGVKNTLALGGPTWFAAAFLSFFGLKQLFAVQRTSGQL